MNFYLFPLLFFVSILAGMWLCERRSHSPALSRRTYLVGTWAGILGARFWYLLQYPGPLSLFGGMSSWGFMIGATIGSVASLRLQSGRWDFGDFADAVAPSVAAGSALTRVACFFIGCNFGKMTDLPWGVRYGPDTPAFIKQVSDGILDPSSAWSRPVHPTQLYESAALLLAFVTIVWLARHPHPSVLGGDLFLGGVIYYGLFRFFVEFIRDDSGGRHFGSLTFAQATSLGVILLALSVMTRNRVKHWRTAAVEGAHAW